MMKLRRMTENIILKSRGLVKLTMCLSMVPWREIRGKEVYFSKGSISVDSIMT
jgi:hypothetical protein